MLVVAAVALGHALQVNNGHLHPAAIRWLTVAIVCTTAALLLPPLGWVERRGDSLALMALGVGLALQFAELLAAPPGISLRPSPGWRLPFLCGLAAGAVLGGSLLLRRTGNKHVQVALMLLVYLLLGAWLIRTSPAPSIDVYVIQRDASNALLGGSNPYAMTFPDIYGGRSSFYGPGMSVAGRTTFGFQYPPLSLLLALPGHVFGGDFRYSQLCAMVGAAALMAYVQPGNLGAVAAALFLFTPRGLFVLEQGWTEPYIVLLLAAVVFCASRSVESLPYMLGLMVAVKQYMVLAAPAVVLLLPRPLEARSTWRLVWKAGATALLATLPLAVINLPAFIHSTVTFHFQQPFRADALSYLAWAAQSPERPPPGPAWSLLAAAVGAGLGAWRAPRTPSGFASAVALCFLGFFAFNKQAFCNYYYLVVGALCVAVGAARVRRRPLRP